MNGVKVTDCRRCQPSRPTPTPRVLDRRDVFGSTCQFRLSSAAAVQQQCSSAADKGWRFVPDTVLPGHRRVPQWVPARTPTVHWGLKSRKAVGGPFGSADTRQTFLLFTFYVYPLLHFTFSSFSFLHVFTLCFSYSKKLFACSLLT